MTAPRLTFEATARDGAARCGTVTTARGGFRTPCFMPVGTRAAVRTLSSADLEDLGSEIILANTYHLMLRPGAATVAGLGGIHGFASWTGHVLTGLGHGFSDGHLHSHGERIQFLRENLNGLRGVFFRDGLF